MSAHSTGGVVRLERRAERIATEKLIAARGGHPYPYRITQALDLRGFHGPEVDIACGAVEPAVDRWETGDEVPTREQVERLAALTGFTVAFFFTPPGPRILRGVVCAIDESGRDGQCDLFDDRPDARVVPLLRDTLW